MGGYLVTAGQMDDVIAADVEVVTMKDIQTQQNFYENKYNNIEFMDEEVFDEVFMDMLGDCEYLFNHLRGEDPKANYFEAIACLLIFCKGRLDEKIKGLFELFDFDRSGDISYLELMATMECCMNGMCKITGTTPPNKRELHHLSLKAFAEINVSQTQRIDFSEFRHWIEKDEEIQEFLVHYNKYQTLEHSLREYDKYFESLMRCFKTSCEEGHTLKVKEYRHMPWNEKNKVHEMSCPLVSLLDKLAHTTGFNKRDLRVVTNMLNKRAKESRVYLDFYAELARAVASFLATDINDNKKIDENEVNALFWLMEGEELTPHRLAKEIELCEVSKKGEISIDEWINYLAMIDPVTGLPCFDFELKLKFIKYDTDGSGTLDIDEVTAMLTDSFQEVLSKLGETKQKEGIQLIVALGKDIMKTMDKDGNNSLDWGEFKQYFHVGFNEKENAITEYMKKNLQSDLTN